MVSFVANLAAEGISIVSQVRHTHVSVEIHCSVERSVAVNVSACPGFDRLTGRAGRLKERELENMELVSVSTQPGPYTAAPLVDALCLEPSGGDLAVRTATPLV